MNFTTKILSAIYAKTRRFIDNNQNPESITRKMKRIARIHSYCISKLF